MGSDLFGYRSSDSHRYFYFLCLCLWRGRRRRGGLDRDIQFLHELARVVQLDGVEQEEDPVDHRVYGPAKGIVEGPRDVQDQINANDHQSEDEIASVQAEGPAAAAHPGVPPLNAPYRQVQDQYIEHDVDGRHGHRADAEPEYHRGALDGHLEGAKDERDADYFRRQIVYALLTVIAHQSA